MARRGQEGSPLGQMESSNWVIQLPLEGVGPAGHGAPGATELCKQEAQTRPAWLETADLVLLEPVAEL